LYLQYANKLKYLGKYKNCELRRVPCRMPVTILVVTKRLEGVLSRGHVKGCRQDIAYRAKDSVVSTTGHFYSEFCPYGFRFCNNHLFGPNLILFQKNRIMYCLISLNNRLYVSVRALVHTILISLIPHKQKLWLRLTFSQSFLSLGYASHSYCHFPCFFVNLHAGT
jgi:hypothetical protein